jgi:CDP-diacylglycerol--glycerol-3-phosphate 3-phosphatidyltransferase
MEHSPGFIGSLISLGGLVILALFALPVFAIQFHRRGYQPSERVRRLGGSRLLGLYLMEYGYWLGNVPLRLARRVGATPDAITIGGLAFVAAASGCLALGWFAVGGWLFLIGCLFDTVDGMLARDLGVCSDAGEYLDAIADRYTELVVFGGLAFYYRDRPWAMVIALAALGGSVMVSYNRAKAEALGVHDLPGWLMRRHERGVYIGFGAALAPLLSHFVEPSATRPLYHLALAACTAVAVLANIAAVLLFVQARRRLRAISAGGDRERAA